MAEEVTRVLGKMQLDTEGGSVKMQLDTEGGSVQVFYGMRDKIVGSLTGEIFVTKAELNEEVTSRFTHKKATRGSTSGVFDTKAQPLNKEVAGRSTRGVGVTKAQGGGISTPEISVTFTPKIGGTKAGLNKEEAGDRIGVTKAVFLDKAFLDKHLLNTGVAADPELRALLYKFAEEGAKPREQHRSETVVPPATMTKHRMPDSYIESIKKRPMRKISPLPDSMYSMLREFLQDTKAELDYLVDLQEDCLRQHKEQGYAEIGVDYTDGVLKLYILPKQAVEVEGK